MSQAYRYMYATGDHFEFDYSEATLDCMGKVYYVLSLLNIYKSNKYTPVLFFILQSLYCCIWNSYCYYAVSLWRKLYSMKISSVTKINDL